MRMSVVAHSRDLAVVVEELKTDLHSGLSSDEARERLKQHGSNELREKPRPSLFQLMLEQFKNFLVILLIVAAAVSAVLGELTDAGMIMAIVILNTVMGVIQESKAEQALAALKRMAAPNARVIRDGVHQDVPSRELVPGDVVLLEAGNYVPADLRLAEAVNLKIEEAALTGESVPVEKRDGVVLKEDIPLGDRVNSAYMSTVVTYGRGKGVVTGTGMGTQIGSIAEMIQSYEDEDTPLQQKLESFGKTLGIACLVICAVVFAIGMFRGEQVLYMFMVSVSLAIAAVPEGLPAIVTICLALGMQRMIRRHALIRKLPAVETLGSCTAICSDKTGTLTQNEMTVVQIYVNGSWVEVEGKGYQPVGRFLRGGHAQNACSVADLKLLLMGATLCNDAELENPKDGKDDGDPAEAGQTREGHGWHMVGDPTEGALVVAAAKGGLWKEEIHASYPRVAEVPFDSDRKCMTTIHDSQDGAAHDAAFTAYVKGAPDILIGRCNRIYQDGNIVPLDERQRSDVLAANEAMSAKALRVLAVAYKPLDVVPERPSPEELEVDLVFMGLLGMIDPARPEVKPAVETCKRAGIKSVMITGDHKNTAMAIARELGILADDKRVMTGDELNKISDEEFLERVEDVDVYARVSPAHKVKIVEALKARGHVAAMTGDGVNDAPALKRSNIGVAMGITGTDVSKETAAMVLTDDNFASIVSAVEEGRIIYSNIRKFVFFLLSCNVGEILIVFIAMLVGLPVPLQPVQLLWLNLLTDGLPALALGMEKGDPDIMDRHPRPVKESILNGEMQVGIVVQSIAIATATLGAMLITMWQDPGNIVAAQTMAFTTLVGSELLRAYTSRSERQSLWSMGIFSNRFMVGATAISFLLLMGPLYLPGLQELFEVQSPPLVDWLYVLPLMVVPSAAAEITKAMLRRMDAGRRNDASLKSAVAA
jgi:P-type Ca2+ transporter type 2C